MQLFLAASIACIGIGIEGLGHCIQLGWWFQIFFICGNDPIRLAYVSNEPRKRKKQPSNFPLYWLVNRDPYSGFLYSLYNRVGFHPLYNLNNQGYFHCSDGKYTAWFMVVSLQGIPWKVDNLLKIPYPLVYWSNYLFVVSTHLKNISQIGNLPQIGVKIKNIWNHHLDYYVPDAPCMYYFIYMKGETWPHEWRGNGWVNIPHMEHLVIVLVGSYGSLNSWPIYTPYI